MHRLLVRAAVRCLESRLRWRRRNCMITPAQRPLPYPTMDQFWRAYQNKERPGDIVARESVTHESEDIEK